MTFPAPDVIDYTSRDFASIRDDLIALIPTFTPQWTSTSENDFGIVLLELWSYVGDILNYYADAVANEGFLDTATQRSSVLRLAAMLGYVPTNAQAAELDVAIINTSDAPIVVPALTQVATTADAANTNPVVFETQADVTIGAGVTATGIECLQGVTVTDAVYNATGAADQSFTLFNNSVIQGSVTINVTIGVITTPWTYFPNLLSAGPYDNAFSLLTDANGIVTVQFGDGANGVIPPNLATVTPAYRVGGGVVGNVAVGAITTILTPVPAGAVLVLAPDANQSTAGVGGVDIETTASIQQNAPLAFVTLQRCVTLDDYANLAVLTPGIGRALAISGIPTSVTVYVAPDGGGSLTTEDHDTVLAALEAAAPAPVSITVLPPTYVGIAVAATLYLAPNAPQAVAIAEAQAAYASLLSFDNVIFGDVISPNDIYLALQGVDGLLYANVTALYIDTDSPGLGAIALSNDEFPMASTMMGAISFTASGGV